MDRDLPTGTVTFLFTDIDGSTRLLHDLGDTAYGAALTEHRHALRAAFSSRGGVEVDTQGDAFFYAFATAPAAVAAAAEGQDALAGGPIRVRMGLHTGTPVFAEDGYVGVDVHRAARIAAVAHGGQVVVSAATAALARRDDLVDLGEHRLKDLSAPERIHQVGAGQFPPLRSLYRTNLPIPATPFLGRDVDVAAVRDLLGRADVRLVTLVGVGGTGKTRLALQAAGLASDDYPDGVFWVPLAAVAAAALVPTAAESALEAGTDVATWIGQKRILLLLDNFEHVLNAATDIAAWLAACPNVDILVTSREPLHVAGEQRYAVPPMSAVDGEQLFLARALEIDRAFTGGPAVAAICDRVDNLPLAIELAAARVNVFTAEQLLDRLTERLPLLTSASRDAPERHRTLRATIAWSHDLLTVEERALFRGLSLFAGGCTLDAVEAVTDADVDTLSSLVDKSLVRRSADRFWMLETIREFALEQLDTAGETLAARQNYVGYYAKLADSAHVSVEDFDQGIRHDLVAHELANLRAAIDGALAAGDAVLALSIAASLENFWAVQSPSEGAERLKALLGLAPDAPLLLRARAMRAFAGMTFLSGRFDEAAEHNRAALELFRQLGDARGVAHMSVRFGIDAGRRGDVSEARRWLDDTEDSPRWKSDECQRAAVRAMVAGVEGRREDAMQHWHESARLAEEVEFTWFQASALGNFADIAIALGRGTEARAALREALELLVRLGDRQNLAYALSSLATIEVREGHDEVAGRYWGSLEAESLRQPLASWETERDTLESEIVRPTEAFEAGRRAGRAMSLVDAAQRALESA